MSCLPFVCGQLLSEAVNFVNFQLRMKELDINAVAYSEALARRDIASR